MKDESSPKTILHLSDTQFGKNHVFGVRSENPYDTLLIRLTEDIGKLKRKYALQPDCVVLTGDLVEWGMPSEFKQMTAFLEGLCDFLTLGRERIIVIPGNHDINRSACQAYVHRCAAEETTANEPFWPKWSAYAAFFTDFYRDVPRYTFTETTPWTLFELPELKMVFAGINSTLKESHRAEDHYGWVGEPQLNWFAEKMQNYIDRGWMRLGAIHHNIRRGPTRDDENLRDAAVLTDILSPYINLFLHGHTHDGKIDWLNPVTPILTAGSAAVNIRARPKEIANQYQIIQFWPNKVKVWGRGFVQDKQHWAGDNRVDPEGDQWWYEYPVLFERIDEASDSNTLTQNAQNAFSDSVLEALQQHQIVAFLMQDHVQKGLICHGIEDRLQKHFGEDHFWRLKPLYSPDSDIDSYFQHLGDQLKQSPVKDATEFEDRLFKAISTPSDRQAVCLLVAGFDSGCESGRKRLAGILRSLASHQNLYIVVTGGKNLAEHIYAEGDMSLLNSAFVMPFPEISQNAVVEQYQQLYPNHAALSEQAAEALLSISGGHPELLNESLRYWQQLDGAASLTIAEQKAQTEAMLSESQFLKSVFLPLEKEVQNRAALVEYLNQAVIHAAYPYTADVLLNDLYWRNLLKYEKIDGCMCLVWRGEVLRKVGLSILQPEVTAEAPTPCPDLQELQISHYFCLDNISLSDLQQKKEIYIVGENGDGKTLFLQAVLLALKGNEDIGTISDYTKKTKHVMQLSAMDEHGKEYHYHINDTVKPGSNYDPVFAYGTHRDRQDSGNKQGHAYLTLFDREGYLYDPVTWLQWLDYKESKGEFDHIGTSAAKALIIELLDHNIDNISISTKNVMFSERGYPVTLDILSEGYRSTIIWTCDLVQRLSVSQPDVKSIQDFSGIVLIDEIDLHLHPKWQYQIVRKIRRWFPKIQFIMTTHSPIVILGSSDQAVFYKLYKEEGKTKLSRPITNIKNMMANLVVTSPLFNGESARPVESNDDNVDTSDDYLYSIIRQQIAKRIKANKGITEQEVWDLVSAALNEEDK